MPQPDYFVGLDLGQAQDFTALCVLERHYPRWAAAELPDYHVSYLHRWPLGTAYPSIVADVKTLAGSPPLRGQASIAVDQTGVGRAVVDLLRRAPVPGTLVPILITAGHAVTRGEDGSRHVPKKELVSALQVLLQTHRIKIARSLPDAEVLAKELENFRVKITVAANELYEAWREGQHDDLVLAVAMAAWLVERRQRCDPWATVPARDNPAPAPDWQGKLLQRSERQPRTGPLRNLFGV